MAGNPDSRPPSPLSGNPDSRPPPSSPIPPSAEWSFEVSWVSIEPSIVTHYSPLSTFSFEETNSMSTVIPETPPTRGANGYTEEEEQYLRILALAFPCVLLLL